MIIRTAAIIGAGAIGSYFIAGLSQKLGDNFCVIAEGERKERLSENGVLINGKRISLNVKTSEQAHGVDLLIVAVKYGALKETLPLIEAAADEHTIILSPLNGVDSESIIGNQLGMERIVYSFMKIASQRVGNKISFNPEITQGLFFGETDGTLSERILAIRDLLDGSGIHYHICENIEQDIWFKYALNISKNLPQAIINCGYGAYTDSEHLAYISNRMRDEVVQVAAARGINIRDESNPAAVSNTVSPSSRFSTLQDLDAKRETEIEMFSGALIRMGKELGVETPFNEFAYHVIKCLEEKNCGKIR